MATIKLKNVSTVVLAGVRPGQVFDVAVDDDGYPLNIYWRARLDEEEKFKVGAVIRVMSVVAAVPPQVEPSVQDQPPSSEVPSNPVQAPDAAPPVASKKASKQAPASSTTTEN